MSQVGYFGKDIVFRVSRKQAYVVQNFSQKLSGRWSESTPIGQKPRSEFNGPGLRQVSFTMILSVALGVKPRDTLRKLQRIVGLGLVDYLVIGKSRIGFNKFKITSISESWDIILEQGELAQAKVDITMEEYVSNRKNKKKYSKSSKRSNSDRSASSSAKTLKYTIKKGDTLWSIAKLYLGKGYLFTRIYSMNKDTIEKEAKKHRKTSSENGHWIYPGTVIEIEVAS